MYHCNKCGNTRFEMLWYNKADRVEPFGKRTDCVSNKDGSIVSEYGEKLVSITCPECTSSITGSNIKEMATYKPSELGSSEVDFSNGTFLVPDSSYVLISQTDSNGENKERLITYHDIFGEYYVMGYEDIIPYNKLTDEFIRVINID